MLRLRRRTWLPTLLARTHQDLDAHLPIHADLARKPELSQNSVLFQAVMLDLPHRGLLGRKLYAAGGAFCLPSTAVADVDSASLDRENQLRPFFNLDVRKSLNVNGVLWHA